MKAAAFADHVRQAFSVSDSMAAQLSH
jgi:hypothetical protein